MSGQTLYEIDLSPKRTVALRELTSEEFEGIFRALANDPNKDFEVTQRGLRLSLVRDGSEALTFQALQGAQLGARFRPKELVMIRAAWERIHLPDAEEMGRVKEMRVVAS